MGGPVNGMAAYVGLLADAGCSVAVYSVSKGTDGESVRLDTRVRHVQAPAAHWGGFRRSPALWRRAQGAEIDLVHSHGLWTDVSRLAGHIARQRGVPHLLAPCGMLAPGALRHHGWKKVPVRFWFQDRVLRGAQCLHAKSHQEYEHIRRFGLHNPVAIIANPILSPPSSLPSSAFDFRIRFNVPAGKRILLFLGRLHPVKGLARLVEAWARIQSEKAESRKRRLAQQTEDGGRRTGDWVLVLAGPDKEGYRREIESLCAKLGCQNSVLFTGELDNNQKWGALAAADLFVMPSDFENFGNSIVEAMSCGIPVITTTGTPWKELPAQRAGWCVEPTVDALRGTIREALAMPEEDRQAMGVRAADFAKRFRPEQTAADIIQVYEWLLERGERPGCVAV